MKHKFNIISFLFFLIFLGLACTKKEKVAENLMPVDDTKPWVYWFLSDASISRVGITRDLEAMKTNGIGGAYLFTIRGAAEPSLYEPTTVQLTPEWWEMIKFALTEAHRLGLKIGIHACDGFTAAGGPWITPELSMQKMVWTDTIIEGGQQVKCRLPQPEKKEDYYRDIAIFAYPAFDGFGISSYKTKPQVTTSILGQDASFLAQKRNMEIFTGREKCWIQYEFEEPFTCRSISLQSGWNNYQANRLFIETSDDGKTFTKHERLNAYRHGWDDRGVTSTHLIKPVRAKFFRFVFNPEESEPGAEDLDDAKWKSRLKISGIELSGEAKIHQFEGKTGAAWRVSKKTDPNFLSQTDFIDPKKLRNITPFFDKDGMLEWNVPEGKWVILRIGHTSTGATNYVGGGAVGLEADKLNPEAVKLQFENWFEAIYNQLGKDWNETVIEELYNDSWECGSQNWSPVLLAEFNSRKGYNLIPLLPVLTGVPVKNVDFSERVLHDFRETIAELLVDNYHGTMKKLAHEKGCRFSTESVAPVFVSDGMLHYKNTDAPTGEFWFRSPSHDKPNDILDAVSAAHIYGKNIVRAEAGTEIRLDWDEHPAMLKPVFDRNFALGVNKIIFHVFAHDPWTTRKPGKTVGVVGQFFQPNQTWWQPGKAWIKYIENCQTLLQQGNPVVDIAVFTGEEIPRRAILPDRLVPVLPGMFGEQKVKAERQRLANINQPFHEMPKGVSTQVNMANPTDFIDPLNGYTYDSFNKDVLLNLAKVNQGKIELPGGASYALLVIPGKRRMNPESGMSLEVAQQILNLVKNGATVYFHEKPGTFLGSEENKKDFDRLLNELFSENNKTTISENLKACKIGKGQILTGEFDLPDLLKFGIEKDFYAKDEEGKKANKLAWNHRKTENREIYFVSNQVDKQRNVELIFRVSGKIPEIYFPVSGIIQKCNNWKVENGKTILPFQFDNYESFFIIFEKETNETFVNEGKNKKELQTIQQLDGNWEVQFDSAFGGPKQALIFNELEDWTTTNNPKIKYYSGTAVYRKLVEWDGEMDSIWIDLGNINNLAEVTLNGVKCGVVWTNPFHLNISKALIKGRNELEIAVTNTWANRLMGDHLLPDEEQITWTNAPYRLEGNKLLPAGLLGPVVFKKESIEIEKN